MVRCSVCELKPEEHYYIIYIIAASSLFPWLNIIAHDDVKQNVAEVSLPQLTEYICLITA